MSDALPRKSLAHYSALALPLAFAGLPLYIHAPDFYATEAGLSLATIGTVLLFIRFFDAVQDPVIGILSNKFSYLRPAIMIGGLITMAAGFYMLFHPPETGVLAWFTLSLILTTTAFSVLSINFNAVGSLWTTDTVQKTRVTTWREGFGLIGLLIAAIIPTLMGLPLTSIAFAGLLALCGFVFLRWSSSTRDLITHNEGAGETLNFRPLANTPNLKFFTIYFISMLASAIPAVLVLFFIRDRLDAEHMAGLFLLLYFISGAAGMPLWQKIAARTNKLNAWLLSMALAIATFIGAYMLGAGDIWQYALICVLSGLALGAELALPPAILSDMIDEQEERKQTSLYFAALAFLSKAALALGSFIAFYILGQAAFTPAAQNSTDALHSLSFTYALLPCFIKLIAASALWWLYKHQGDINAHTQNTTERTASHGNVNVS